MKRTLQAGVLSLAMVLAPQKAHASIFGEETIVLGKILMNAIEQLMQLQQILSSSRENLELLREIHDGINQAINLMRTVGPYTDPGIYKDWRNVAEAVRKLQEVYGTVIPSRDAEIQKSSDQNAAEAIALNNSIYEYADKLDDIGEQFKQASVGASPKGASRLTVEALGVMITMFNQLLRAQATGLKIQAQTLAVENRREKEQTRHIQDASNQLRSAMRDSKASFDLPRF